MDRGLDRGYWDGAKRRKPLGTNTDKTDGHGQSVALSDRGLDRGFGGGARHERPLRTKHGHGQSVALSDRGLDRGFGVERRKRPLRTRHGHGQSVALADRGLDRGFGVEQLWQLQGRWGERLTSKSRGIELTRGGSNGRWGNGGIGTDGEARGYEGSQASGSGNVQRRSHSGEWRAQGARNGRAVGDNGLIAVRRMSPICRGPMEQDRGLDRGFGVGWRWGL